MVLSMFEHRSTTHESSARQQVAFVILQVMRIQRPRSPSNISRQSVIATRSRAVAETLALLRTGQSEPSLVADDQLTSFGLSCGTMQRRWQIWGAVEEGKMPFQELTRRAVNGAVLPQDPGPT